MLGTLFALLSSAAFGFNGATIRRGVLAGAASQGLYITIFVGLPLFAIAALISGQLSQASTVPFTNFLLMASAGVVHILVGRYSNYRAVLAMGANRSAPLVGSSMLVSVAIAIIFLDEVVTPTMAMGIVLIMSGPILVTRAKREPEKSPNQPKSRLIEGYVFGITAAVFWGLGPVLMRAAVADSGLGILGGLVTYITASTVLALSLLIPGQFSGAMKLGNTARKWFLISSLNSFVGNLFRYTALGIAPVTIVVPLMQTNPVFTLGFNFVINRNTESFHPFVIAGMLISIAGAILLVL
jgi:drug/metabolite transporter (DMT)-like permease